MITTDIIQSAEWIWRLLFVSGSVTAVVVHVNLCSLASLTAKQEWLRQGTIAVTVLAAIFTDLCLIFDVSDGLLPRLAFASAIPASFGTMALLFTAQYNKWSLRPPQTDTTLDSSAAEMTASRYQSLTVECPACNTKQQIAVGSSRCPQCGLGIEIRLLEPTQATGAA